MLSAKFLGEKMGLQKAKSRIEHAQDETKIFRVEFILKKNPLDLLILIVRRKVKAPAAMCCLL